jgi:hypothetical protein
MSDEKASAEFDIRELIKAAEEFVKEEMKGQDGV